MAILKHLYQNFFFFAFSATPCWLKALDICAEGFWIRANLLHEVRWYERVCIQSLKPASYPLSRRLIKGIKQAGGHKLNPSSLNLLSLYLHLSQLHLEIRQSWTEWKRMFLHTYINICKCPTCPQEWLNKQAKSTQVNHCSATWNWCFWQQENTQDSNLQCTIH